MEVYQSGLPGLFGVLRSKKDNDLIAHKIQIEENGIFCPSRYVRIFS